MKKSTLILMIIFIGSQAVRAQQVTEHYNNWWNSLNGKHILSDKVSLQYELHIRREDYLKNWFQFLFRPMINYNVSDKFTATFGYTYIQNYPYRKVNLGIVVPENNIWEQILYKQKISVVTFKNRLRYEQRWPGKVNYNNETANYEVSGHSFATRLRNRFIFTIPLFNIDKEAHKKITLTVFDEVFYAIPSDFSKFSFQQNWAAGSLKYHFNDKFNISGGFMLHYFKRSETLREINPTILFGVAYQVQQGVK